MDGKLKSIKSKLPLAGLCGLGLAAIVIQSALAQKTPSALRLVDEVKAVMSEHFYEQAKLPAFLAGLEAIKTPDQARSEIKRLLEALQVSHTAYYTPDELEYYELLDIYKFSHAEKLKTLFPPDGVVRYPGIGVAPRLVNGRYYADFVYAGAPAARAGIRPGDELLAVDDREYSPIMAFEGKLGQRVKLLVRREQGGPALEHDVVVENLNPTETFIASTIASGRTIERKGRKFGYIRLCAFTDEQIGAILVDKLSGADFAPVEALILDLRGRWGGAPLDAAEIFVGGAPKVDMIAPGGERIPANFRWTKPLVVIIGPETRSGLEIMAYALKKAGLPLIGANTRGALMAGRAFILEEGGLLLVAGRDVQVDGRRLEWLGVAPTTAVEARLEYSQGRDPQLEAAMNKAEDLVGPKP